MALSQTVPASPPPNAAQENTSLILPGAIPPEPSLSGLSLPGSDAAIHLTSSVSPAENLYATVSNPQQLIPHLSSNNFTARTHAQARLIQLGESARAALMNVTANAATFDPEAVLRATNALNAINQSFARNILREIATPGLQEGAVNTLRQIADAPGGASDGRLIALADSLNPASPYFPQHQEHLPAILSALVGDSAQGNRP